MQQRSIAQTHLVKFTLPSLVNNVLGKGCPHEIALLFRKPPPAGLDGLPRAIECGHQDANGTRIKNVVIGKEVTHLRFPSRAYIAPTFFIEQRGATTSLRLGLGAPKGTRARRNHFPNPVPIRRRVMWVALSDDVAIALTHQITGVEDLDLTRQ
jgi:hypothetical protein